MKNGDALRNEGTELSGGNITDFKENVDIINEVVNSS